MCLCFMSGLCNSSHVEMYFQLSGHDKGQLLIFSCCCKRTLLSQPAHAALWTGRPWLWACLLHRACWNWTGGWPRLLGRCFNCCRVVLKRQLEQVIFAALWKGFLFSWQSSETVGESCFFPFSRDINSSIHETHQRKHSDPADWNEDLFEQQLSVMVCHYEFTEILDILISCFYFSARWSNWGLSGLFSGGWTSQINGDSSKAGLAEGGSNNPAHLPPESNLQCQVRLLPPHLTHSLCLGHSFYSSNNCVVSLFSALMSVKFIFLVSWLLKPCIYFL